MKKITISAICAMFACISAYSAPFAHHRPTPFRPLVHLRPHCPPIRHHAVRHHGFGPALPFLTGLAAGAAVSAAFAPRTVEVVQQPVVVGPAQPVVISQPPPVVVSPGVTSVWVPGAWVETRKNGIVISRRWVEGHWEYR